MPDHSEQTKCHCGRASHPPILPRISTPRTTYRVVSGEEASDTVRTFAAFWSYKPPTFSSSPRYFPSASSHSLPSVRLIMEIKHFLFCLLAISAAALPNAPAGDFHPRSLLVPRDKCSAAGPQCTGEKWWPDCPGGYCMPFQGPHIGFWCCVSYLIATMCSGWGC